MDTGARGKQAHETECMRAKHRGIWHTYPASEQEIVMRGWEMILPVLAMSVLSIRAKNTGCDASLQPNKFRVDAVPTRTAGRQDGDQPRRGDIRVRIRNELIKNVGKSES